MFFQQAVGINALIYYSPTLFKTMGLNYSMQLVMSGVLNVTQLVGVSTSLWTMGSIGRRPLLLWGSFFMTLSHIVIAVLVGRFSNNWPGHRDAGWFSVAFLLFYMLSFGASWGPVPWAMPSEIFPSSLRASKYFLKPEISCSVPHCDLLNTFWEQTYLFISPSLQVTPSIK